MTERDSDIEFDFFDEPQEREQPPTRRLARRGPRRPVRPPTGLTPLLRLVGLIAFAILVIVLLVFWVQSCRGASKRESYSDYMQKVTVIADNSQSIGRDLSNALTTPGTRVRTLQPRLLGLAQQQVQDVERARDIGAPGPLRSAHQQVVEALQLRVSGLRGLADTFGQTARSNDFNAAGALLATQAQRLVASDVIWDDLFKDPAASELRRQGIGGVAVPDSNFLRDADAVSRSAWIPVLRRLRGTPAAGTATGRRGNGLVSVKALPSGSELSRSGDNTIRTSTDLAFEVTVENSGESQEVRVPVTLTIQRRPEPIVQTERIDSISPGEQKTVLFEDLPTLDVGVPTTLTVEVRPVPGETLTTNNSAEYPIIFSLTP